MTVVQIDVKAMRVAAAAVVAGGIALPAHAGLPCPLRTITGVPCPLCGLTTSVKALMHLHGVDALRANPGGVVVVAGAVAVLLFARRWAAVRIPAALPIALVSIMWIAELFRFHIL